jgi:hypothetical protein
MIMGLVNMDTGDGFYESWNAEEPCKSREMALMCSKLLGLYDKMLKVAVTNFL